MTTQNNQPASTERESVTHELKTWPDYFEKILSGEKNFEVRKNDRGFKTGDTLVLKEWVLKGFEGNTKLGNYTGREIVKTAGYILSDPSSNFGLMGDTVVISLIDPAPLTRNQSDGEVLGKYSAGGTSEYPNVISIIDAEIDSLKWNYKHCEIPVHEQEYSSRVLECLKAKKALRHVKETLSKLEGIKRSIRAGDPTGCDIVISDLKDQVDEIINSLKQL